MTRLPTMAVMAVALAASLLPGVASAQGRLPGQFFDPAREAPPLTVRKRPFTDSGTAVPYNYEHEYLSSQTYNNVPTYASYLPDRFGRDVLPRRFDGLGLN